MPLTLLNNFGVVVVLSSWERTSRIVSSVNACSFTRRMDSHTKSCIEDSASTYFKDDNPPRYFAIALKKDKMPPLEDR